jgi:hypothetical protein
MKTLFASATPEVKQIEYINKRGQRVTVWPWTLNKHTTLYQGGAAIYIRGSKKG